MVQKLYTVVYKKFSAVFFFMLILLGMSISGQSAAMNIDFERLSSDPTAAPIQIVEAVSLDTDDDANVDTIRIEFDTPIVPESIDKTDFLIGNEVHQQRISGVKIGESPNTVLLGVELSKETSYTPRLAIVGDGLWGGGETARYLDPEVEGSSITVRDGVAPGMLYLNTIDFDSNGLIDAIQVQFTEGIDPTSMQAENFAVSGYIVAGAPYMMYGQPSIRAVPVQEKSAPDTDRSPEVRVIGEGIRDKADNILYTDRAVARSFAGPAIFAYSLVEPSTIRLQLSESVVSERKRINNERVDVGALEPDEVIVQGMDGLQYPIRSISPDEGDIFTISLDTAIDANDSIQVSFREDNVVFAEDWPDHPHGNKERDMDMIKQEEKNIRTDKLSYQILCNELNAGTLSDIQGHWAQQYISFLHRKCIVQGRAGSMDLRLFAPDASVTKAEVITMIYRVLYANDSPNPEISAIHRDTGGHRAQPYIDVGYQSGRVDDGVFSPDTAATRDFVVHTVVRATESVSGEIPTQSGLMSIQSEYNRYSDINESLYPEDFAKLSLRNVINGYPDGTLRPRSPVTRAEMSKILVQGFRPQLGTYADSD